MNPNKIKTCLQKLKSGDCINYKHENNISSPSPGFIVNNVSGDRINYVHGGYDNITHLTDLLNANYNPIILINIKKKK